MSHRPMLRLSTPLVLTLIACASHAGEDGPPLPPANVADSAPADPPPAPPAPQVESGFDHTHAAWDRILGQHVQGDLFDYGAMQADRPTLVAYLQTLRAVTAEELTSWSEKERYAFWINAYNAHTIQKVVDNYPLASIRKLDKLFGAKSVFDNEFIRMQALHPDKKDDKLSLNDIEHKILRARFQDARVHAAINCASDSCPPLLGEALVAERLDEQLDAQMRAFVIDPERNTYDREANKVRLSEIFKWFEEDFERDAGSVRKYLLRYAPESEEAFLRDAKIQYQDYSWDLNDTT